MQEKLLIGKDHPILARHFDYDCFTYSWHSHPQYEIIYIESGEGSSYVADHKGEFRSGDIIVVGGELPHYLSTPPGDGSRRVKGAIIQFAEDFMASSIGSYVELGHIKRFLELSRRGVLIRGGRHGAVVELLMALPRYGAAYQIIHLLRLLDLLAREDDLLILGSEQYGEDVVLSSDGRLKKVLDFISINYTNPISLEMASELAAMNSSAFSRFFRERVGRTFTQYILDLRIELACRLLCEQQRDIVEVAILSGFRSPTYFCKMFKRSKALSPSTYRKLHRGCHLINKQP